MNDKSADQPSTGPKPGAGVRVLVIDDDDFVRTGLVADLTHAGYQVEDTHDPRKGLEQIRQSPPEAVLLDVMMHGTDGIAVLRELRMDHPDLPVVMITGHGSMDNALAALRAGASDYIQKPAVGEDVAHRVNLAIQAEHGRRLQQESENYEQKVASLQTLAGGVAHDLNNQLTVIMTSTQELMEQIGPESPGYPDLKWIAYSSSVISRLADRLLSYSGGGNFVIRHTDLSASVPEMLEKISARLQQAVKVPVRLSTEIPPDPVWVAVDRLQFSQGLDHLVSNAYEALERTGGKIWVRVGLREVDAHFASSWLPSATVAPGMYASLRVEDDGPGMDPETLEKIFDPFFSTKFTGRGMGLPSAQGVFRGHQGHLLVSSEPAGGTVVEGLLPLVESDPTTSTRRIAPMAAPAHTESPGSLPTEHPPRGHVLVIDDEVLIRRMTERALTKVGFRVSQAPDGATGLEIFQSNPAGVDLVMLDLSMPGMDGVAVLGELRAAAPNVRVLLISGFHSSEVVDRFGDQRPDGFLQKPFSVSDLRERVSELVEE